MPALVAGLALIIQLGDLSAVGADGRATAAPTHAAAAVSPAAGLMPAAAPTKTTPWVLGGEVSKIVQVGNVMVAGGVFRRVTEPMNGRRYNRQNLFAFNASTGRVSRTFSPRVDGRVRQLLPGPTAGTVYVAGDFTRINGKGPSHLQLLNVTTGRAVRSFQAPSTNGRIATMQRLPRNRLFIGGSFTKVGGVSRGQLVTLNATTGAFDRFLALRVAGRHNNTGSGARGPVGARESAITPTGNRLVVTGNFRKVGGQLRAQIVMINLTGRTAKVAMSWNTKRYRPICSSRAFDSYIRDVEMSPDGSFFVVATTGGAHPGTLCDTAARFQTYAKGNALAPTWTNSSGGDTLWGVEITRAAVYVGGHSRWMNNPSGSRRAGRGAVPRPGLAALDPQTGIPLQWNPGRHPRGEAAYEIYATGAGVWVVSDTKWIGNRRYRRPRIAFFPYSGGDLTAPKNTGSLPGNIYVAGPGSTTACVISFDGTRVTARHTVTSFDWTDVRGAVMVGRTLFYGQTDGFLYRRSFDGAAFGTPVRVDPYLDPRWRAVKTGSGPRGETYAGRLPTWYGQLSTITGMFYSRGRIYYTRSGHRSLYWRWFSPDSGIVGGIEGTATGGKVAWGSTKGMFLNGRSLYFVDSTNGHLMRMRLVNGAPVGAPVVAEATTDWRGKALFLVSVPT